MAFYLTFKELWYHKGRFLLIALIVALITTLVLFVAALAEGLGAGNTEYLEKLNGELIVYQANVELSTSASRVGRSKLAEIRRVEGVRDVGQVAFSTASLVFDPGEEGAATSVREPLNVSLVGVEPGRPGEPPTYLGRGLGSSGADEVVIGRNVALRTGLSVGDWLTVKAVQGIGEELYRLRIVGVSDGRQFFLQPSVFVPILTWEKIRPQAGGEVGQGELVSNVVVVQLVDPGAITEMADTLASKVDKVEVVDRKTAYEATPGYAAQQSTLSTQKYFTLFIGVLVIGGFFQIQTLQKVAQIGVLKAIGAPNTTVAIAAGLQIVTVNAFGVLLGSAGSLLLSLGFPVAVPIVFTPEAVLTAIASLMLIGPIGGLVSVFALLRVEPLTALGLSQ